MRAERLGSYSIVATLPGTPNFSRLKSISRIFCLWPPPWWRIVRSPELRRPPVRLRVVTSGLCGFWAVKSSVTRVVWNRSVGVTGLYVLIAIVIFLDEPSALSLQLVLLKPNFSLSPQASRSGTEKLKADSCQVPYRLPTYSGIFSPAFRRTYAFFQSGRKPVYFPRRRSLPSTFEVRTAATFTLKSASTACFTSVLVASGATSNTSVSSVSFLFSPFSVIRGRRIVVYVVGITLPPSHEPCASRPTSPAHRLAAQ